MRDDDPHIGSPCSQGLSKNCDNYRTSSCSSGYGSSIGQDKSENILLSFNKEEDKAYARQNLKNVDSSSNFLGLQRIHSLLHFDEINEEDTKQLVMDPEDKLQKEETAKVNNDYAADSDSCSEIDKTSLVARGEWEAGTFC